jgi:hypothetical protein
MFLQERSRALSHGTSQGRSSKLVVSRGRGSVLLEVFLQEHLATVGRAWRFVGRCLPNTQNTKTDEMFLQERFVKLRKQL